MNEIYEALFKLLCCIMIADGRASRSEKTRIRELMVKVKSPWTAELTQIRISEFIATLKAFGGQAVIDDALSQVHLFRESGPQTVLLKCLDLLTEADGRITPHEKAMCDQIRKEIQGEMSSPPSATKRAPLSNLQQETKDSKALTSKTGPVFDASRSMHTFHVGDGELAISLQSPIVYLPAHRAMNMYSFLHHAFRGADGEVQRAKAGFYAVRNQAAEIRFLSANPELVTVGHNDKLGLYFTFRNDGLAIINIEFCDQQLQVPIKIVKLVIHEGDDAALAVRAYGLPDEDKKHSVSWPSTRSIDEIIYSPSARERIIAADHWKYREYPYLVVSIVDNKVYRIGSDRHEGTTEFVNWMTNGRLKSMMPVY